MHLSLVIICSIFTDIAILYLNNGINTCIRTSETFDDINEEDYKG